MTVTLPATSSELDSRLPAEVKVFYYYYYYYCLQAILQRPGRYVHLKMSCHPWWRFRRKGPTEYRKFLIFMRHFAKNLVHWIWKTGKNWWASPPLRDACMACTDYIVDRPPLSTLHIYLFALWFHIDTDSQQSADCISDMLRWIWMFQERKVWHFKIPAI